ncbi:MAG: LicD family protein [bacterium]|nr:LicD family protein [bacterium]
MRKIAKRWQELRRRRRKPVQLTGVSYEVARRMLLDAVEVFEEVGVGYHLAAGTLLGVARDGDLIPWDDDVDLTVPRSDLGKLRRSLWKLRLRGWKVRAKKRMRSDDLAWKKGDHRCITVRNRRFPWSGAGRIKMDIFITYEHDDYRWWGTLDLVCRVPADYMASHHHLDFHGHRLRVPVRYVEYLELMFGDWRNPRPDFDSSQENRALIRRRLPDNVQWPPSDELLRKLTARTDVS